MQKQFLVAAVVGFASLAAQAADVGVSAELGTTGIGAHISVPVQKQLNARFGVNAFNYSYDGSTSDVTYDFKLKLQTADALLDWHPMDNGFRVTAGAVYNGTKITGSGRPSATGTYTLNGRTYSIAQIGTLDGKVDFRKAAPYLGIGWGNAVKNDKGGFGFTADVGVLFQGSPRTSLTNSNCNATALVCTQLANDVAAENARLKDEVKDFKYLPVVRVGVSYRF